MVSRTKLVAILGSVVLLTVLLALGLASVSAAPGVDLAIGKWSYPYEPGPVMAGQELIYYISVRNNGDTTATGVQVVDTLPAEVTYIADTGGCTLVGAVLTCSLDDLEPGAYREFEIKVYVPADAVAWTDDGTIVIENNAVVSSAEADDDRSDNSVTHSMFVEDLADLSVTKMSKPDFHVQAGDTFVYTIIVENLGPSSSRGVALIDNMVSSGDFNILDWEMNRPGNCAVQPYPGYVAQVLYCELYGDEGYPEALEPKGFLWWDDELQEWLGGGQWIIQVWVFANETQDVDNVVNVFTTELPDEDFVGTEDPNLFNNTAEDFISVEDVADLSIDKYLVACDGPDGACVAGAGATFGITVTNNGPSMGENVVVEDFVPAGVTVVGVTGAGGCNTGIPGDPFNPLTCNLGNIPPRESRSFSIGLLIDPDYPLLYEGGAWVGYLENDVWVHSDIFDPNNVNNLDHVIQQIGAFSYLDPWKECPETVVAGEEFDYLISVENDGPSTVYNLGFGDVLTDGLTFLGYQILLGDGTCLYTPESHTFGCALGNVDPGESRAIVLTVRVRPDYAGASVDNNEWVFGADTPFQTPVDNYLCETAVLHLTDLSIQKSVEPMKVYPGQQQLYHVQVTNNGTMDAIDVIVTDSLPAEVDYEIDTDNCDLYSPDPDVLECHLGTIPGGQTAAFDISVLVQPDFGITQTVEITNTALVSMPYDTNPDNNMASVTNVMLVPTVADVGLAKTVSDGPHYAGKIVTFTLTVTNTGPLVAQNVVLEDVLPAGLTVVGVSAKQGSCTTGIPGSVPLVCNLGNLGVDQETGVQVEAFIDPGYSGPLENDASVRSDIEDPDQGNNLANLIVMVEPLSDLWVEKIGPEDIGAGQEIHYNINVANYGPSTAHNLYVNDKLPDEVALLGAEIVMGDGSCVEGTGLCSLGDVDPYEWHSIHVWGFVQPWVDDLKVITNTAEVWAESPFTGTLTSEVATTVHSQADLAIWKTADPYKVYAGEQMRYDVTVVNNGPSVAKEVLVTDYLPYAVEYEVATIPCAPGYPPYENELYCPLGDIPPGETRNFSILVRINPDAPVGVVMTNHVSVTSDNESEQTLGNNEYTEGNWVMGKADLRVQKYGPSGPVEAPGPLIYTMVVDNLGPGYGHNVQLRDLFTSSSPAFFISNIQSAPYANCSVWQQPGETEARIFCLRPSMEVYSPFTAGRWVVQIYVDVYEDQSITNVADVVSDDEDPDPSNNHDEANNDVEPVTDLQLMKWAEGEIPDGCYDEPPYDTEWDRVAAGASMRYELEVCNMGPSRAENVVLEDWGISPLLDITPQDVYSYDGGVTCLKGELGQQGDTNRRLTCYLGYLPDFFNYDGNPFCKTIYIEADVPSDVPEGTILLNEAKVYGDLYDHQNWNNFASNSTTVEVWADLGVEKTQEPEVVLPGQDITYSIMVTNEGPSDALGAIISDTVPPEVLNPTWTCCCSSDGGECDVPCEVPTCPAGECPWPDIGLYAQADIPADGYAIYTIEGTLGVWPCLLPITNTAQVIAPESLLYEGEDIDPCDECNYEGVCNADEVYNIVPVCNFDPLILKQYPGPDSPP